MLGRSRYDCSDFSISEQQNGGLLEIRRCFDRIFHSKGCCSRRGNQNKEDTQMNFPFETTLRVMVVSLLMMDQ